MLMSDVRSKSSLGSGVRIGFEVGCQGQGRGLELRSDRKSGLGLGVGPGSGSRVGSRVESCGRGQGLELGDSIMCWGVGSGGSGSG